MKYLFTFSLLIFLQSCHAQETITNISSTRPYISKERSDSLAKDIPQIKGFINDYVQLFIDNETKVLDSIVHSYEKMTSVEICLVIIDSSMVTDRDFEDYTLVMMNLWEVGKKETSNGILIVISPDMKRMRIQNGYRVETFLSDAETKQIIDNAFIPMFKKGKYFEGTMDGIIAITSQLKKNGL